MEGLISPWHIAILVVILLLAFGPKRLPELGSALGKTMIATVVEPAGQPAAAPTLTVADGGEAR